ncbi:unnamed protein product [Clonostachys chloroleuca]|uniref:Rhodopsin domain-containing protein n=1 Tax=Clonostachys chloroleuca TaxID=1926264 RepID=A0AA35M059_9HYPO|nr:unnamed protein product [Clonostachys chloroleuca]
MDINWDLLTPQQQEAVLNKPLAKAPPGFVSRVGQPRDLNVTTISLAVASQVLVTVLFLLRVYARVVYVKKFRTEDAGTTEFGIWSRFGRSVGTASFKTRTNFSQIEQNFIVLRIFYAINLAFAKNAILLEWIHIFVPLPRRNAFFWICVALMVVNTGLYVGAIIATCVTTLPIEAAWKPWIKGRTLVDRQISDTTTVSFNLLIDILILILPQMVIWKLKMNAPRKIGLSILFCLGIATCIFAGGRVYKTSTVHKAIDRLYNVPIIILWGLGESTLAMVVFCVPAIPKLFSGQSSGVLSKFKASLQSWAAIATGSNRSQSKPDQSGQQSWPAANTNKFYHKMQDGSSEVALTDLGNREDDAVSSRRMDPVHHNSRA